MLDQLWPIFDIFWLESLKALAHDARRAIIICRSGAGVHKTVIRGIQDTRQITKKIKTKKVGPDFLT